MADTPTIVRELVERRDRHTKHYATNIPGRFIAVVSNDQHFRHRDGHWEDLANLIESTLDGFESVEDSPLSFRFGDNGSYTARFQQHDYRFSPQALYLYDAATGRHGKVAEVTPSTPQRQGNRLVWHDLFPGIDLEATLQRGGFAKQYILRQRLNLDLIGQGMDPATTYLVVAYDVDLPNPIQNLAGLMSGSFQIQDGDQTLHLPEGKAWNSSRGNQRRTVNVQLLATPTVALGLAVPYTFLASAKYPVYIDPTTTLNPAAGADDGYVQFDPTFTSNPDSASTSGASFILGSDGDGKSYAWNRLGFFRFNLAGLAASALNAATLSLYTTMPTAGGSYNIDLLSSGFGSGAALAISDRSSSGTTLATVSLGSTANAYQNFSLGSLSSLLPKFGSSVALRMGSGSPGNSSITVSTYEGDPAQRPKLYLDYTAGATAVLEQEGFLFRNDDGSEASATSAASADTGVTAPRGQNLRLRILVKVTGAPRDAQLQLEYKKSTDSGWTKVQ